MEIRDRMIVALDYPEMESVKRLVEELGESASFYKVGLELYLNSNGEVIEYLNSKNKKIFLDLKFHDIPNTTIMASIFATKKNVEIFNVHSGGGKEMMKSVAKAVKEINPTTKVIGVTVLTSFSEEGIDEVYKSRLSLKELVLNMAKVTKESGMDGVVCSAWESKEIKEVCGKNFITVTPGIRLKDSNSNDQKRVMTPKEAIKNGCDYLVIGRDITRAENPKKVVEKILNEIEEGLKEIC